MVASFLVIVGVGVEWFEAYQHFPPHSPFGTVFFTMTGVHASHVLTGLIVLAIVVYLGRRAGRFGSGSY